MRKVIITGASGLIGSTITRFLQKEGNIQTHAVSRNCRPLGFKNSHDCDMSYLALREIVLSIAPSFIINCVGLTKHLASAISDTYLFPNILVPEYLRRLKLEFGFSLIHISSDCVFQGINAPYSDTEKPDAVDNYGISKAISEKLLELDAMILRTSTVGHENHSKNGLVEWFLNQSSEVAGYKEAYFNGVTTLTLAKLVHRIISSHGNYQTGIYNVASDRISKYDFLLLMKDIYGSSIRVLSNKSVKIDRSLIQSQHISLIFKHSDWESQLIEMKEEYINEFNR